ncbi:MAG: hypothetical protein JST73_10435 [Actinobacteria bacterium]|nr:hypothetical protein [Actinomycetota bacterium]
MTTRSRTLAVAAVAASATLFSACGVKTVGVSGRAAPDGTDVTTTVSPETTTASSKPSTTEGSSTTAPDTSEPTNAPTTTAAPTGRSDAAFCAAAGDFLDAGLNGALGMGASRPDRDQAMSQFKQTFGSMNQVLDKMDQTAPPPIEADMHTLATAMNSADQSLQSAQSPHDLFGSMRGSNMSGVGAAAQNVMQYAAQHCGFSLTGHATN